MRDLSFKLSSSKESIEFYADDIFITAWPYNDKPIDLFDEFRKIYISGFSDNNNSKSLDK